MIWKQSDLCDLALASCRVCRGTGVRGESGGSPIPCGCVLRAVFRACHARFRKCVEGGPRVSQIWFDRVPRGEGYRGNWSRKEEEYKADFELVSRRSLDEFHYRIFRYHFLLGADWKLCCRKLGMNRGNFYHAVYRIQERLGRVFYELEPYGLYPPRDYFAYRRLEEPDGGPGREARSATVLEWKARKVPA